MYYYISESRNISRENKIKIFNTTDYNVDLIETFEQHNRCKIVYAAFNPVSGSLLDFLQSNDWQAVNKFGMLMEFECNADSLYIVNLKYSQMEPQNHWIVIHNKQIFDASYSSADGNHLTKLFLDNINSRHNSFTFANVMRLGLNVDESSLQIALNAYAQSLVSELRAKSLLLTRAHLRCKPVLPPLPPLTDIPVVIDDSLLDDQKSVEVSSVPANQPEPPSPPKPPVPPLNLSFLSSMRLYPCVNTNESKDLPLDAAVGNIDLSRSK